MNLSVLRLTSIKADPGPIFEGEQVGLPREINSIQMPYNIPQGHDLSYPQPDWSRESHSKQDTGPQNRSDVGGAKTLLDGHSHHKEVEVRTASRASFALMH